jgi:transmembrane sensor
MDANDRRARATDEAAQWWTRLGTKAPADVSETDRQEFTQWLRESPLHVAELLQIAHVHDTLERFKLWGEISVSTEEIDTNVIPLNPNPQPLCALGEREGPAQGESEPSNRTKVRSTKRVFLAASVSLIAIAAGWLALRSSATTIETDRAERREVVLNDGSVVNLEPETALRVNFGKLQRYVILARGRALFHVAKDSVRPFIVHAGDTNVRAVGTIFGVEQKNQNIIVTVSEGKVGVVPSVALASPEQSEGSAQREGASSTDPSPGTDTASNSEKPSNAAKNPHRRPLSSHGQTGDSENGIASGQPGEVFLTADQQITVRQSGDATPVQNVDSSRALAWSKGRLVFDSTPLSDVADEFNRYNRVQLLINSPDLARRTVSGVFRASDPETLIDFIGAGAHVVVTRHGNEEIVISPRP